MSKRRDEILNTCQMRSRKAGGTRKVIKGKDTTKYLLKEGQRLYFPIRESSKGKLNEFHSDVWDYPDRRMDGNLMSDI